MIYTTGYTGKKSEDLKRLVERLGARLIDIRYSRNSRWPQWRRWEIESLLGDSYCWLQAFGNRAYKLRGHIEIDCFEIGEAAIANMVRGYPNRPLILLCVCHDYATCHRRVITEKLKEHGYEVEELGNWGEGL